MIDETKKDLKRSFDMTDLGLMHYCLGLEVWQKENHIFVSQMKYTKTILEKFRMMDCTPIATPMENRLQLSRSDPSPEVSATLYRQLIGSLIYLTYTRPDISFAVSYLSRFMQEPKICHWKAAKRILRYLKGLVDLGLEYKKNENFFLIGYSDSDHAGNIDDRKSTSGFVFFMGSGPISWGSKKQHFVSRSSTEAEYSSAGEAVCEAIWLRRILEGLGIPQDKPTTMYVDNEGVLKLVRNPVFHERTEHIEVQVHFICEHVLKHNIQLQFCPTAEQRADIFTKSLARDKFELFRAFLSSSLQTMHN
ncbi:hypothetical protein KI387_016534 [Taxus chinensis]|uniref:Reverse transcriptase Ty1/copia-type domain-containing protein n=1 Tax=Taxus chinensis TaxID=29808 RepID=A0AA38GHA7_TAXCH|nr:hypothetical protein KI387_016534 [Taxus chinensis]